MVTTSKTPTVQAVASRLRFVIARTHRRMRQRAGVELTPTQVAFLATIARCGPITPSELAETERVKRPTATRVAAFLEERRLIDRAPHPTDGRGSLLTLSPEGRTLMKRLRSRKDTYLAQQLSRLDADELETLDRASVILERLLSEPEDTP
jgi:DNA-binding MarR family transcriptional regulator